MEAVREFLSVSSGYGDGYGDGYGYGSGSGSGDGSGSGYGDGNGDGVKRISKQGVNIIDGVQTIITKVKNNIAKGFILNSDLTLKHCWIAKRDNLFAHGDTLKDAVRALREKVLQSSSVEERIVKFKEEFPDLNKKATCKKYFEWHGILTGSCKAGREAWCKDHGISMKEKITVYEFIKLTENAYGGDVIKKLKDIEP